MPMIRFAVVVAITFLAAPAVRAQAYHSDAIFCSLVQQTANKANADAGAMVDAVTVNVGMAVMCNMKVVNFVKKMTVSFNVLKAGWQARKQAQWNQIYCEPGSAFRMAIDAGWTISHTMTDVDGNRHYMVATCR